MYHTFSPFFFRLTFTRVTRKGSTEEFSCIPYIIALLNCLLYTWFGLPVVSKGWENFTVATINGLGILLETSFIIIYMWFSSAKRKARLLFSILHHIVALIYEFVNSRYSQMNMFMQSKIHLQSRVRTKFNSRKKIF